MTVRKKTRDSSKKDLSMRHVEIIDRVRKAIQDLPPDYTEPKERVMAKSKGTPAKKAKEATNGNGDGGTSLAQICKKVGIEPRAARRHLRNSDITVEGGRWSFGKGDATRVEKLLREKTAE